MCHLQSTPSPPTLIYKIRNGARKMRKREGDGGERRRRRQEDRKERSCSPASICSSSWEESRAIHQSPYCCLQVFSSLKGHSAKIAIRKILWPALKTPSPAPFLTNTQLLWATVCLHTTQGGGPGIPLIHYHSLGWRLCLFGCVSAGLRFFLQF